MEEQSASAEDTGGVTWAEIARRLRRVGVSISRATVRKYQANGLIPGPHPVGRTGKGPGVDWVWTPDQAESLVTKIRALRTESVAKRRLRRVTQQEVDDQMLRLFRLPRRQVPRGALAWLTSITPEGSSLRSSSLGAQLIDFGLDQLDRKLTRPGTLLVIFAPDPEPVPSEEPNAQ